MHKAKLFVVLSAPEIFGFMRGQPERMRELGYEVSVVGAVSQDLDNSAKSERCHRLVIDIRREISLAADLKTFVSLIDIFRRESPSAVIFSGPKACFLGSLAAFLADIPLRLSIYHGMRQETERGILKWVLNACDFLSCAASTQVLTVSNSLLRVLVKSGLDPWGRSQPITPGTANGVDLERLMPKSVSPLARRDSVRARLGIGTKQRTILVLGRITEDKGLLDIPHIFKKVTERYPDAKLLIVGKDEIKSVAGTNVYQQLQTQPNVHFTGHVTNVGDYIAASDLLLMPTRREGFGMAIIEAGALGVPTVGYNVTGVMDAVINGQTGILVTLADKEALAGAAIRYFSDEVLIRRHGDAAQEYSRKFSPGLVWENYARLLSDR